MITTNRLSSEITGNRFGDPRLTKRLGNILDGLAERPGLGLPRAMGSEAALEGIYRFLKNPKVDPQRILGPHIEASCERASQEGTILVLHDTTVLKFKGSREGLGVISRKDVRGFYAHFALGIGLQSEIPLGVLGIEEYVRTGKKGRRPPKVSRADETSEHHRWMKLVEKSESSLSQRAKAIHVMDREGDSYEHFAKLAENGYRFVIRAAYDRKLDDGKLFETLKSLPGIHEREVPLSKRIGGRTKYKSNLKIHPARESRTARLSFSAAILSIKRPWDSETEQEYLSLNVVNVVEVKPPKDQKPVQWILWTTEPISSINDVLQIVDIYRNRWLIEEFFKAIKTGCSFEKKQLEGFNSLSNALAIYSIVAWRLLALRSLSRTNPKALASTALTPLQIKILKAISKKSISEEPTVHEALYAIAALGGHIPNNGPPGWLVLGRGFEDILLLERHYYALREVDDAINH